MNLCQDHWEKLKKAIDDRGLSRLCEKTSEGIFDRAIEGTFDPLLGSSGKIFQNALDIVGLDLMRPGEDGKPPCPVCYLVKHCQCGLEHCHFGSWIEAAADGALSYARENNLVPSTPV